MWNIDFSRLKVLLPLASGYAIALGIINLILYYNAFNIQITRFLDFTEILTSFLDKLILILIVLFGSIGGGFYIATNATHPYTRAMNHLHEVPSRFERFLIKWSPILAIYLPLIILWIIFEAISHPNADFLKGIIFMSSMAVALLICYEIFKSAYLNYFEKSPDPTYDLVVISAGLGIILTLYSSYYEINWVKNRKRYTNTKITTLNGELVIDANHYYIGNTRNYLFYYDQISDETTVYPMSEIKLIKFGEKELAKSR